MLPYAPNIHEKVDLNVKNRTTVPVNVESDFIGNLRESKEKTLLPLF